MHREAAEPDGGDGAAVLEGEHVLEHDQVRLQHPAGADVERIINSISEDANVVKIPNIVVNTISVLIMSLNNSIKTSEKCDLFRRLGQQFLLLSGQIENDNELTEHDFNIMMIKYENLVNECLFEEIPGRYKTAVAERYRDRHVPLQLLGTMPRLARAACKGRRGRGQQRRGGRRGVSVRE